LVRLSAFRDLPSTAVSKFVEIVRTPAGELADGLDLLRLPQSLGDLLLLVRSVMTIQRGALIGERDGVARK